MQVVVIDDNPRKLKFTYMRLERCGIDNEKVIVIGSRPKDIKWLDYIPLRIKKIKMKSGNVLLMLDYNLGGEEDETKKLLENLLEILTEGDVIICNSSDSAEQMQEYKNLLLPHGENETFYMEDATEILKVDNNVIVAKVEERETMREIVDYCNGVEGVEIEARFSEDKFEKSSNVHGEFCEW